MREAIEQILHFQSENAYLLPLNVPALCRGLGLELRPVTDVMRRTGMPAEEIYGLWGNRDGVLQRLHGRYLLCWNNGQPRNRQRFTMCEEISHFLLHHLDEPGFDVFSQDYREEVYQRCEREARFSAGMLLCPPRWYYAHREELDAAALSRRCRVSMACARHILADFEAREEEIRGCPTFGYAPVNGER